MTQTPRIRKDTAQAKRFIEAAHEAGCSEDEAEIRNSVRRIVEVKIHKSKGKQNVGKA